MEQKISVFKVILSWFVSIIVYFLSVTILCILLAILFYVIERIPIIGSLFNFWLYWSSWSSQLFAYTIAIILTIKTVSAINKNNILQAHKALFGFGITICIFSVFGLISDMRHGFDEPFFGCILMLIHSIYLIRKYK
jgi:hypothetical protein